MSRLPAAKVRTLAVGNPGQQVFIVLATGAVMGLVALATQGYVVASKSRPRADTAEPVPVAAATSRAEDEVYTGSILYMPNDGRHCHQLLFDNQTGRLSDNGTVDCASVAYRGIEGPQHGSARIRVIATGFRGD